MGRWDTLVVSISLAVLYLALSWQARSDQAQDFLTSLEEAARAIAESAAKNYDSTCDLLDTCRSEQNCSKRECFPLESQRYQCVLIHNFTRCAAFPGSQCNRALVDFDRGVTRLPGNASVSFSDDELEAAFGPTVCAQRELDATFKKQKFSYSNESFYVNMFFGAVDGVLRVYPARESLNDRCNTLEPRGRPWYVNAISVKKDLVVVLDSGASMTKKHFLLKNTSLDTAKRLTSTLAQNLSAGDTLTVISVNSSGSFLLSRLSMSDDALETRESLSLLLSNPALSSTESLEETPSQFKAAFDMANSTSGEALKIIVVFTNSGDGNVPPDLATSTLIQLKAAGLGVFAYDLASESTSSPWDALCRRSNVSSTPEQNPFLFLHSYYSFLARARAKANKGNLAFWTKPYLSASDLGEVMTVSYRAMSSDDTMLLGVVGIDVQTGGLPNQLKGDLDGLLDSDAYNQRTSVPTISAFADTTCSTGYLKSCTSNKTEPLRPFCHSRSEPASDPELHRWMCCTGEGCSTGHHKGSLLWMVWIAMGVVLLGVVGLVFMVVRKSYNNRSEPPEPKFPPPVIAWEIPWEIPLEELNLATKNFAKDNIVGTGAFGVVYRGLLRGQKVAVKRLTCTPDKGELRVNMKIPKHPHLVELKGACFEGVDTYLVYELVEGGDMSQWLWPDPKVGRAREGTGTVYFLSWKRRRQIAQGIAKGLDYLHFGLPDVRIYHLDLKPSNVLLGENFTPKIADFGLSQLYEPGRTFSIATVKGGTIGYMAPEILQGCLLPTTKMDVYSFGVVLMQLISGRRLGDTDLQPTFLQWARNLVDRDDVEKVIDKHLLETVLPRFKDSLMRNLQKVIDLAMDCTERSPESRPEMTDILWVLANLEEVQESEVSTQNDVEQLKEIEMANFGQRSSW